MVSCDGVYVKIAHEHGIPFLQKHLSKIQMTYLAHRSRKNSSKCCNDSKYHFGKENKPKIGTLSHCV